ncbi:hypothetical protein [Paenibacillus woosongensis]|uniref:Uncharacterized protein n=1 Tax=Paenibacillus woosongensis TaxID=307580 RepID=A0A7X2Z108_9BACL|nr:hypothetical protein [Paenibacillus woosongensis]MUG45485.1 hypothetical protein [Paenibacillus woosongensis]
MIVKDNVEHLIGRELTEKETRTIDWLNTWEASTSSTIAHLINAAYINGRLMQKERNKE